MKKESWIKKHLTTIILSILFLAGLALLLYPSLSDWWNSLHQTRVISDFTQQVNELDGKSYKKLMQKARKYNRQLAKRGTHFKLTGKERKEYNSLLDIAGTGMMGYVEIPAISVSLPVYHGTGEAVLSVAVGHIEGSSLPVGGKNSHCVLSGHRGLPSAKLFTDLDKLVEGDVFYLQIMNETLTYEVDRIRIVEPWNVGSLSIKKGKDYCTLVTCTPYGINSHRLLVRGHRVKNPEEDITERIQADAIQIKPMLAAPLAAVPMLLVLLVALLVTTSKKKGKKKTGQRNAGEKNGREEEI